MAEPNALTASDICKVWRIRGRAALSALPDGVALHCERLEANAYRDMADALLGLFGPRSWCWRDARGAAEKGGSVPAALAALSRDARSLPLLLARHRKGARRVLDVGRTGAAWNEGRPVLYLRMDHIFDLAAGGSLAHTAGVINALRSLTSNVAVLSTDHISTVPRDESFQVITPQYRTGRNVPSIPLLNYSTQVVDWWQSRRFPIGFVYGRYSLGNYAAPMIAHAENVPYVCEYNGSSIWIARNWSGRPLRFERLLRLVEDANLFSADLVVAVSDASRDELVSRGLPAERVLVNPNGVDPEVYRPNRNGRHIRKLLGIGEDEVVIGFIGTFGQWHGTDVLADAFGRLLATTPGSRSRLRLLMIGDGHLMPRVREILAQGGVTDRAFLPGLVPQAEAPDYLAACDILASPHVPNPDGTPFFGSPTKLFEYMATESAIVASNLDQIGKILQHGRSAWLVPPANAGALADGLRTVVDDAVLRRSLGAAARRECLEHYTWQRHTERILDTLRASSS